MLNLRTLTLAACLAACSLPASAEYIGIYRETEATTGALGQTWTGAWSDGWNITEWVSDVTIAGNTLSYDYLPAGAWLGTPTQTYVFSTTAARAGALTLDIDLSSNALWNGSATGMYIWQGSTAGKTLLAGATGDAIVHRTVTLDLADGEAWGFMAVSGSIGDNLSYTGDLYGSFTVTAANGNLGGEVPEPASLALLGAGLLGAVVARRRKA